ncbi:unnamed protein product [Closterium sp. NIES-65]|nr:unnamed protein product [Closterium sp. NIES-65]
MRSKTAGVALDAPGTVYIDNNERINSPGDNIQIFCASPFAGKKRAASNDAVPVKSCVESVPEASDGHDEEKWPENGHYGDGETRATPDLDVEEDEWWLKDYGDEEVEVWRSGDDEEGDAKAGDGRAGDGDADTAAGVRRVGFDEEGDAEAGCGRAGDVEPSAAAAHEGKGEDGDAATDKGDEDEPGKMDVDDVPLFRRIVKHRVDHATLKETGRFTAAEKNKQKVDEGPSRKRLTTAEKGKQKVDEGPSKRRAQAAEKGKQKKKRAPKKKAPAAEPAEPSDNPDDDYAEAAGPIPTYPEKQKPKDPTKRNMDARPPYPRNRGEKCSRRGWTVKEKLKWSKRYAELGSLKKTAVETGASVASIWRCVEQRVAGVYKGAATSRKRMHGAGRHPHYPDMEEALYRHICVHRAEGMPISMSDTQKWSRAWIKKHHKGKEWAASSHWSQHFRDRWNIVMRVRTKVGQKLSNAQVNGWMDEEAVGAWLRGEILPDLNPVKGAATE